MGVAKITYVQTTVDSIGLHAVPVPPGESVKTDSLITASRMAMWNACRRKHHNRYVEGYADKWVGVELTFGHLWHKFMEYWWSGRADLFDAVLLKAKDALDAAHYAYFSAMVKGYQLAHDAERPKWTVVALEKEFRGVVFDPRMVSVSDDAPQEVSGAFALAGKVDGILQDEEDRVIDAATHVLLEHKTTSRLISDGEGYWDALAGDHQVSLYFIGMDSMGFNGSRCLYDVARKPALRQKKTETFEQFYQRVEDEVYKNLDTYFRWRIVPRQTREVILAAQDVWETGRLMEVEKESGFAPRNPAACYQYGVGKACAYINSCFGGVPLAENPDLKKLKPFQELNTEGEIE